MALGPLASILARSTRYPKLAQAAKQTSKSSVKTRAVPKGYMVTANNSVLPEFEVFPGGGGKSAGAGAGDHPTLDNRRKPRSVSWIPTQPTDPVYDAVSLIDEILKNYEQPVKQSRQVTSKRRKTSPKFNPRKEPGLKTVSPSGEIKSEFESDTAVPSTPSRNDKFRDYYYDYSGKKNYTRAPHTYYEASHERDICAAVALRSHNGGKGASKAQVQAMIRAWYYCNSKKG